VSGTPSTPPTLVPASSRSTAPRRATQPPHARQWQRRADAFDDQRPGARRKAARTNVAVPAPVVVGGGYALASVATVVHPSAAVLALAVAVASGSWLDRRRHRQLTIFGATGTAIAVTWGVLGAGALSAAGAGVLVATALVVAGFGALPRVAVRAAIAAARRAERERADAEVVRLIDDARRLRALAGRDDFDAADGDDALRDVGGGVAQRDRLFRLLGLVERGVRDVDSIALYTLDDGGASLTLVEQRHVHRTVAHSETDAVAEVDNHARLALGARGVGPAGLVGLAAQRKVPLRVTDADGGAVGAHRSLGPKPQSALCVPLLSRGVCTGVIVVDRVAASPFSADDEAFVRAAAAEVQDGLAMERVLENLDGERRRVARVFAAARALAGVARRIDVQRTALELVSELCAGAAFVDVRDDGTYVVDNAAGTLAPARGEHGALDPASFVARCAREGAPLPHVALDRASPRPLLAADEAIGPAACGDLRAIPLVVAGDVVGALVVVTRPGERLASTTIATIVAIADVTALSLSSAKAFDAIERRATTDGLTGVWNRRTLDEKLHEAAARAKRSGTPVTVLLTDVDHFKSVNDTWGHATGDEVLKGVAKALSLVARATDVVGRLGGEEFVVVCEGTDLGGAVILAERMRAALKALTFETPKGPLSITSSFGVALVRPGDDDGHKALEAADKQLYRAKAAGRDRVMAEDAAR